MYAVPELQIDLCNCGQQSAALMQTLTRQMAFLDQFFRESPTRSEFLLNLRIRENHLVEDRHRADQHHTGNIIEQIGSFLTSPLDYLPSSRPSYFYPNLSYSCYMGSTVRNCK
jgi:hypothetical protein